MKKSFNFKKMIGAVALAMVCVMLGCAISVNPMASADTQTVVVTSPFTEAISKVRGSVVGVNNYQTVRSNNYGNYGNNYGNFGFDFDDFFNGFGFGFGNGGYGYGNGGQNYGGSVQSEEVLAACGSGVVVAEGYVLTNFHVVEDASSLKISVVGDDGEAKEYDAMLTAYDEDVDVAVLKAPDLKLEPVTLGDSDKLQVGDWAICIGNPLSDTFTGTVTAGIVSGLDRNISSTNYDKYGRKETITNMMIQTDAAINNGNSGGGMFNVLGELVGIPTLKYSGKASTSGASIESIGMCIPINAVKAVIDAALNGNYEMKESATAAANNAMTGKPRLGISITSVNTNNEAVRNGDIPNGVYVSEVEAGGPAENAGMMKGDIIVDVNDTVVTSVTQLQSIIAEHGEGDVLKVKVFRMSGTEEEINEGKADGEYVDLEVTLAIVDAVAQ